MAAEKVRGIVVIPADFGETISQGHPAAIQIVTDGAQPNQASFIAANAEGVRMNWMQGELAEANGSTRAPGPADRCLDAHLVQSRARKPLLPRARLDRRGHDDDRDAADGIGRGPRMGARHDGGTARDTVRMSEFIASKVVPYFLLGLASMALCTVIAITVFALPLRGVGVRLVRHRVGLPAAVAWSGVVHLGGDQEPVRGEPGWRCSPPSCRPSCSPASSSRSRRCRCRSASSLMRCRRAI